MEITKKELKLKLKEAQKNNYIYPLQVTAAFKKFKQSGDIEILKTIEIQKAAKLKADNIIATKWHDLSDSEALQTIVRQNNEIIIQQQKIKGWVTFLGIVTLIGLIAAIFVAIASGT